MGIKQKLEDMVNRWLFKEEIEQHEQMMEQDPQYRKQHEPSEEDIRAEAERTMKIHSEQIALIKAEDHSKAPSKSDIKRYFQYHVNMVENVNMIRKHTGQEPPFPVPSTPLTENEYTRMVESKGWNGMRMSCGLPTGDISKPKKPWTMADGDKKWSVDSKDTPEIHWKSKD